jgi:hypothetical protein
MIAVELGHLAGQTAKEIQRRGYTWECNAAMQINLYHVINHSADRHDPPAAGFARLWYASVVAFKFHPPGYFGSSFLD